MCEWYNSDVGERRLLFLLQLQRFMASPQGVVLLGERDVSHLQLLQHPLALAEPAQENKLLHTRKQTQLIFYDNYQYTHLVI